MTASPALSGADVPAGAVSCNRCNLVRPRGVHPCPWLCPEYALAAADREPESPDPKRRKTKAPFKED